MLGKKKRYTFKDQFVYRAYWLLSIGACLYIASLVSFNAFEVIQLYAGYRLGMVLPDLDTPTSYLGNKFRPLSLWIDKQFGQYTFMHSMTLLYLLMTCVACYHTIFGVSLCMGFVGHLILDLCCGKGIMLLYPFFKLKFGVREVCNLKVLKRLKNIVILSIIKTYTSIKTFGVAALKGFSYNPK